MECEWKWHVLLPGGKAVKKHWFLFTLSFFATHWLDKEDCEGLKDGQATVGRSLGPAFGLEKHPFDCYRTEK